MNGVALIGYSGHALVAAEILRLMGREIVGYFDIENKSGGASTIPYLGHELDDRNLTRLRQTDYFVSIGNNDRRHAVVKSMRDRGVAPPITIQHPSSVVASTASIGPGVMIGPSATINPSVTVGLGAICNSACVIEHECDVGHFCHIAPGAVLAGNVLVGDRSFIGANAVVREGVRIGSGCVIGAGAVIIRNIPDGSKVVGNPGRIL